MTIGSTRRSGSDTTLSEAALMADAPDLDCATGSALAGGRSAVRARGHETAGRKYWWLVLVALFMVACATPTATPAPTAAPVTFDVAAVQASFTEECADPIVVDELFCQQVKIGEMTADGSTLLVPTELAVEARDRADAICEQVARVHFDGDGEDLGYEIVGVLNRTGGNAAACSVD